LKHFGPNPFASLGQRIAQLSAAGKDIIRLDIGSPDLPPPPHVIEALERSAEDPSHHGYAGHRGELSFRMAIAAYYMRRFGVELDPHTEIMPLIGSKEGLVNLTVAYLDRGDAALIPSISYPTYTAGALMAGADPIYLPLRAENNYLLDLTQPVPGIERAKLLWINYPNNPTGAIASLDFYEQAVAFCRAHNLLLCSDNPYVDVTFGAYRAPSALQVRGAKDMTVEFISLSKSHNMAGWRLGACVGNREALNNLVHVKSTLDSGSFRAIYDAGTEALNTTPQSWIDARNERYRVRRDLLMAALPEIGLEPTFVPEGSLYIWARIAGQILDEEYTNAALESTGVSITPGSTYGDDGRRFVRISLGVSDQRLDEALSRLKEWYRVRA
jgi:LL-diaminopimelate aminotransferase